MSQQVNHWQVGSPGRPPEEFRITPSEAERQIHVRVWIKELERHRVLRYGWQSRVPEQHPVSQGTVSNFMRGRNISKVNVDRIIDVVQRMTDAHFSESGPMYTDLATLRALIDTKKLAIAEDEEILAKHKRIVTSLQQRIDQTKATSHLIEGRVERTEAELARLQEQWEYAYMQEQDRIAAEDSKLTGESIDVQPLDSSMVEASVRLSSTGRQPDKRRAPEQRVD